MRHRRSGALAWVLLLSLGGCATGGNVRHNADGTLSIRCSGGYHDWSRCLQRARSACGAAGFEEIARISNEGSEGVGTRDWSAQGSEVQRTLEVRCRGGAGGHSAASGSPPRPQT